MAKHMVIAAGGGVVGAILYLATFLDAPGGVALAYLALLPLFAVGFGFGSTAGAIAAAAASVLVAAVGTATLGIVFALVYAVPAAGLSRQALLRAGNDPDDEAAWYPTGRLAALVTIYGCGLFAALALAGGEESIAAAVREIESVMAQVLPTEQNPQIAELMRVIAGYFPAIVLFSWVIMVVGNAALAQALLARSGHSLRPTPRYVETELPSWFAGVTAAVAGLALLAPWSDLGALTFVARNAALALLVPYFLVGLAVVHAFARRRAARVILLVGFYLLLLVFGWPALLVAGLGFMEQWLLLRRRFAEEAGQEDER